MTDLVVIVPSRGRPQAAAELAEAFTETSTADTRLAWSFDEDDPRLPDYPDREAVIGENQSMVEALNKAALHYARGGFFKNDPPFAVGFMGDDHRPRTKGWDKAYIDALRELGTGLVYGNDLLQGERIPTQVAMTADIVRTLGYMAPPKLGHMYVDNAWLALGRALDRITYLPGVIIEHLHPLAGKGEWDEGYNRVNSPGQYDRDRVFFQLWLHSLPGEVAKLRSLVDA